LKGQNIDAVPVAKVPSPTKPLSAETAALYAKGAEIYRREGHCITCHQDNGLGLPAALFPPLAATKWVQGNEERLIKLTLHGLLGPIEIKGKQYPGQVPMTPFKGLSDEEIAAVLTYVRNTFGNHAAMVSPAKVKAVRAATADRESFYLPADLLEEHPHE
jgi:mono/diheme cytochrome c family protein